MSIPKLRSPILFVHGLFGFDRLKLGGWTLASYFGTIPDQLREAGNIVKVASLSPTAGVAERAKQLKAFVEKELPNEPMHIFAHSMGGLDSRYMISCLDMAPRVITLTTIGTPHRGTSFADWGIRRFERIVKPILAWLNMPHQAFYDLTTHKCNELNEQAPDAANVRYFSIAGRHVGAWRSPEWLLSHQIVTQQEGDNDGVVSLASARYGESFEVWDGDHLSLVNMPNPVAQAQGLWIDRSKKYVELLGRLKDEGY